MEVHHRDTLQMVIEDGVYECDDCGAVGEPVISVANWFDGGYDHYCDVCKDKEYNLVD